LNLRLELDQFHRASYGWALACCAQDPALAEDVLQTVYVKVLEGRARYNGQSAFTTWLFAVIRKTAADAWRHRLLRVRRLALQEREIQPAHAESAEETFERAQRLAQLRQGLRALPGRQRQVLHLVFYQDLSLREAAGVMGVSVGTARVHYERGKKRLRQHLEAPEVSDDSRTRGPAIQHVLS
jgi:RNA polymerase sigma-70 factor (ECF subfamily)